MPSPSSMNPSTFAWSYGSIPPLTVSVGTPSSTISDVGAAFSQTTLNNNFRSLADKVNAIISVLQSNGTLT